MRKPRYRTAMKARHGCDDGNLLWCEDFQRAVSDQVGGVLVVLGRAHGAADVVQQSGKLEQFALARTEAVRPPRRVEQEKGKASNLPGVGLVVVEPPRERMDASAPLGGIRGDFPGWRLGAPRNPRERIAPRQPQLAAMRMR